jgi:hypothetical protein
MHFYEQITTKILLMRMNVADISRRLDRPTRLWVLSNLIF